MCSDCSHITVRHARAHILVPTYNTDRAGWLKIFKQRRIVRSYKNFHAYIKSYELFELAKKCDMCIKALRTTLRQLILIGFPKVLEHVYIFPYVCEQSGILIFLCTFVKFSGSKCREFIHRRCTPKPQFLPERKIYSQTYGYSSFLGLQ